MSRATAAIDGPITRARVLSLVAIALCGISPLTLAQEGVTQITIQWQPRFVWTTEWATTPPHMQCGSADECASSYVAWANAGWQASGTNCSDSINHSEPNYQNTINGQPFSINFFIDVTCTNAQGLTSVTPYGMWVNLGADCGIDEQTGMGNGSSVLAGWPNFVLECQKRTLIPQSPPPNRCPKPEVGNPISGATGAKLERGSDYRDASGLLSFERSYNSWNTSPSGATTHNHAASLVDLRTQPTGPQCYPGLYQALDYVTSQQTNTNVYQYFSYCYPYYYPPTPLFQGVYVYIGNNKRLTFSGSLGAALTSVDNRGSLAMSGSGSSASYSLKRNDFLGLELFDANGRLTQRIRADGKTLNYAYAANPNAAYGNTSPVLQTVTDSFGRALSLAYRSDNQLASLTDPAGQLTTYLYGQSSATCASPGNCTRLTSVIYPDQSTKSYYYDEPAYLSGVTSTLGRLTGIADENGSRYANFTYDSQGRAIATEHAGGAQRFSLSYSNDVTNTYIAQATITDPLGSVRTMGFTTQALTSYVTSQSQPAGSGCAASSSALGYDVKAT